MDGRFGRAIIFHYEEAARDRLKETIQTVKQDPTQHILQLEQLILEWQSVAKRDHLNNVKRRAYEELVKQYRNLGLYSKAHEWATQWRQFDEYDLHAKASEALTFYYEPEFRQKGKKKANQSLYRNI